MMKQATRTHTQTHKIESNQNDRKKKVDHKLPAGEWTAVFGLSVPIPNPLSLSLSLIFSCNSVFLPFYVFAFEFRRVSFVPPRSFPSVKPALGSYSIS